MKLLSTKQVIEATGLCRTTIWRLVRDGLFPKPIKIGSMSRFDSDDLDKWLSSRKQEAARQG
jgi:prophage regulatory protein